VSAPPWAHGDKGGLQLLVEGFAAAQGAFVQQADGGHVGEGLADAHPGGVEGPMPPCCRKGTTLDMTDRL
jgi:hypothetical protein